MGKQVDLLVCDLLLPLYRAAREVSVEEFQHLLFQLMQEIIRFDSGRWGTATITTAGFDIRSQHLWHEPETLPDEYTEVKDQDWLAKAAMAGNGATISATTSQCFRNKRFAGIRDYTIRHEHRNSLLSAQRDHGSAILQWVSLYRAREHDAFGPVDRDIVQRLLPHLREALVINRQTYLGSMKRGNSLVTCAVMDRAGFLHHAETEFLSMLKDEFPLHSGGDLPERIIGALQREGKYVGPIMAIESQPGGGMLFLKARPISRADHLSPREIEIARLVAQGLTYKEIGRHLVLSPATVRTYLQRIHEKLATHNIVEIANCLRDTKP